MFGLCFLRRIIPCDEANTRDAPVRTAKYESALEILNKRYARGEMGKVEFERMKKDVA